MSDACSLIDSSQWVEPTLVVADEGQRIEFHIQDAFNYHGYDAVGGVVLGFRLLQKAIAMFTGGDDKTLLLRRQITLFTAFPGLGARDCFELVTRMVTEKHMTVDTAFSDTTAQAGVAGRFYFAFSYQGQRVQLAPVEGYPVPEFIALGKASKLPGFNAQQRQAWRRAKYQLANTLLGARADTVIRVL